MGFPYVKSMALFLLIGLLVVLPLMAGCGGGQSSGTPTATQTPKPSDIARAYAETIFNPDYWAMKQGQELSRFSDDFIRGLYDPLYILGRLKGLGTYISAATAIKEFYTLNATLQAANYSTLFILHPIAGGLTYRFNEGFTELATLLGNGQDSSVKSAELRMNLQYLTQSIEDCPKEVLAPFTSESVARQAKDSAKQAVQSAIFFLDGLSQGAKVPTPAATTPAVTSAPTPTRTSTPSVTNQVEWSKTFGGARTDMAYSVQQTSDGGYIIAGCTESYGAGIDVYLIKTDSYGQEQWSHTFGGSAVDWAFSVQQTSDGGYIIAGDTYSYGAGNQDVYLIKTDSYGQEQWSRTFGGSDSDRAYSV